MARAHAHILTAIWSDPEWVALSQNAQHTYLLLLSQPKLNMVGLLDVLPSRWARLAADSTPDSIGAALDELEASRFIVVDHNTDELIIRSLVRHDTAAKPSKVANPRVLTGLWRAWESIESRQLRAAVLNEIPASVWDSDKVNPPAEARNTRSGQKLPPEPSSRTDTQNFPQDPLPTSHDYAVADSKQPGNSRPRDPSAAAAVDNSAEDVFKQALDLLVAQELDRNPTRGPSPERHAAGIRRGKRRDHLATARTHLDQHPDTTPEQLAEVLEPASAQVVSLDGHRRANSSPYDETLAAQMARAEANTRQLKAERVDIETTGLGPQAARQALRSLPARPS